MTMLQNKQHKTHFMIAYGKKDKRDKMYHSPNYSYSINKPSYKTVRLITQSMVRIKQHQS